LVALGSLAGDKFEASLDCCAATPQVPTAAATAATSKIRETRNIGDSLPEFD
jgi:hypothetical protein